MATIKDVAKLAGVSVATVSRVLNDPSAVKEDTRLQVQQAIGQLHYSPNFLGRNLRQLETKRILAILDSISNQFYSRVVHGIEDKAREQEYSVMVCAVRGNKKNFLDYMKMLQTRVVDGAIIMCPEIGYEEIVDLNDHYPIVCACEPILDSGVASASINDFEASRDAAGYLIGQGKRRIAIIGMPIDCHSGSARVRGYQAALEQHGIPLEESLFVREGYTYNAGMRAVRRMLEWEKLPDAVFAFSDACAIGAIKEFSRHGISVPGDISVMGFDNTAMSEVYLPSITTVAQPQYDIGYKAMELLCNKINGIPENQNIFLAHDIISRGSVKKEKKR